MYTVSRTSQAFLVHKGEKDVVNVCILINRRSLQSDFKSRQTRDSSMPQKLLIRHNLSVCIPGPSCVAEKL